MSYSFEMLFIPIESKLDGYEKADRFVQTLMEVPTANEHVRNNLLYFVRQSHLKPGESMPGPGAYHFEDWLSAIFTARFTCWPEYHLLGVLGGNWPEKCLEMASRAVLFQNGTDQDYEFECWPKLPFFRERINKVGGLSDEELAKRMDLEVSDIQRDINYWQRSAAYLDIFKDLALNSWLYGDKGPVPFNQFAMNGILSGDMSTTVFARAHAIWSTYRG